MTTTRGSWAWIAPVINGRYDEWQYATDYGDDWDGRYRALCPHGRETSWVSSPRGLPVPQCTCRRTEVRRG